MVAFLDAIGSLRTRVTELAATKVLGAPPGEVAVRAPAVRRGARQAAAGSGSRAQESDIPEVYKLYWGDPKPGGGVTIFTTAAGYAKLQDEDENVRVVTARRIARYVMAQERWAASKSLRSEGSVANEILCHAHRLVDDPDMSIEYVVNPEQRYICLALGLPLDELAAPDDGVV